MVIATKIGVPTNVLLMQGTKMDNNTVSINKSDQELDPESIEESETNALQDNSIFVPELPRDAQPDYSIAKGVGGWLDDYIKYAETISPLTPHSFHLSGALWLPSVAIARRLYVDMPFGKIYPNIYVLWVASSTLHRKTTALSIIEKLARETFPYLLAPQDTTPEALISDMSGKQPTNYDDFDDVTKQLLDAERDFAAQRGLIIDEMSGALGSMERDYNMGLLESWLRFYDCAESYTRSTITHGRTVLRNTSWSVLGASTPMILTRFLKNDTLWANGFWPRFFLVTPTNKPEWREAKMIARPPVLSKKMLDLIARLPREKWPGQPIAVSVPLCEDAFLLWSKYSKALTYDLISNNLDEKLITSYGRFPVHALKVSLILGALDEETNLPRKITLPQMVRAIQIVEDFRASLHRITAYKNQQVSKDLKLRVIQIVAKYQPQGASVRDIANGLRDVSREALNECIEELVELKILQATDKKASSNGGRPTTKFLLGIR